ncbi:MULTISPECIES: hypothetical protein [Lonsdalea]|uniref:Uncharacterized protein n=2 Tax=Lonsdalea TaxID=1082702 RepID=A0ACD1JAT0_9GAMM|nr:MULTISPECIES: hypothetical protein [Lonsdalea]RAT10667.1 hypothetical protein AU485_16125 [Lonsdalea quercina]RAT30686.1 hypothetical protein AU492_16485 [Lonsdalea populi]RAT33232.1 hypothetical protein AU493_15290 [Lonsdalea populi]RAT62493.1 hypothetical protein AU502_09080 [Lonsdalea populi]RAT65695.1 hypothetical protein AU503_10740 [Lonsdalea populi]
MKNSLKNWLQSASDNEWTNEDKCREAMQQIHAQSCVPESQEQAVPVGELIANFLAVLSEPSGDENLNGHHGDGPEGPGYYCNGVKLPE